MIKNIITIIVALLAVLILMFTGFAKEKIYDCNLLEFHPDIPKQVREECRRLRYEHWKLEQDEKKNDQRIHEDRANILRT
jgi:hypothetical protein